MSTLHDPTDLRGLEADAELHEERAQTFEQQAAEDVQWLMNQTQGRRLAGRWLEFMGVWKSSFHTNPQVAAFNEGQRNVGLMISNELIKNCPDAYLQMLTERRKT